MTRVEQLKEEVKREVDTNGGVIVMDCKNIESVVDVDCGALQRFYRKTNAPLFKQDVKIDLGDCK